MRALIFDCDGVLADTERFGHLPAFNQTFAEFNLPVQWTEEEYATKLLIGGGKERMASLLTSQFVADASLPEDTEGQKKLLKLWHERKTAIYTELVASGRMPARPGINSLVREAVAAAFVLAVASTSAEAAVRAVLEHAVGRELAAYFRVFAGDIVPAKKPSPDIYTLALRELGTSANDAIVIEDSANGLRAAASAGIRTVVTTSSYTADEDFSGAALVVSSLGDPGGEQARVLADPLGIHPQGGVVRITDLITILTTPREGTA